MDATQPPKRPAPLMLHRIFAPASLDSLFSDAALLAAMARFERGLAQAQAAAGLIPEPAAQAIGRACNELGDPAASDGGPPELAGGRFDPARLYPAARTAGTLVIPFLKALGEQVATIDAGAVRYLHHGATSQDVIDTALAMQCKEAGRRLLDALERTGAALSQLAQAHRDTMMIGRTVMQSASPAGSIRCRARVDTCARRCSTWRCCSSAARWARFPGSARPTSHRRWRSAWRTPWG